MPTLNWIGKESVLNHDRQIPTRLLECEPALSFGDPDAENLLVEGDNLEALKALLPRYRGSVKCIYIDPPYNTGNENWIYNDNVNDPRIRKWLGKVVGDDAEDLCRHDKWLCMMYPRLAILRDFLADDGAIFVSIDDTEVHHLRGLMDEVFGPLSFVTQIAWQKIYTVKNSAKQFSEMHDHLVVYAPRGKDWIPNLLRRTSKQDDAYSNPDKDKRGNWKATPIHARNEYRDGLYEVVSPDGKVHKPPTGTYWRFSKSTFDELNADNRIWWGEDGESVPARKSFLSEVKDGVVPSTMWLHQQAGHNAEAKTELRDLLSEDDEFFTTPKPVRLVRRILEVASDPDSIVMDSFAGSGTTGQAVLELNRDDGSERSCILVEIEPNVARRTTAPRLRRAVTGEGWRPKLKRLIFEEKLTPKKLLDSEGLAARISRVKQDNEANYAEIKLSIEDSHIRVYGHWSSDDDHPGFGAGFKYCKLGRTLLDEFGDINGNVPFTDLARYVYLLETGVPVPRRPRSDSPLLGVHKARAIYLLYNGVLGDRRPAGGNVLTNKVLSLLPDHPEKQGIRVIFGEATRLSDATLARENIVFRQIPYSLRES